MRRRAALAALPALAGCAVRPRAAAPRVVVVGGGFAGATAAKYLRRWSKQAIDVVLVEPGAAFVSCPMSNLVVGGSRTLAELTVPYDALGARHGVRVVRERVVRIDAARRRVQLASATSLDYDRLVLAPGIDMLWDAVDGLREAHAAGRMLHAWKAGPETLALRAQLAAMRAGGVFAIAVPEMPYRCPPGPYERACQAAWWLRRHNPRAKVLVLDANDDLTSKGPLFRRVWSEAYAGMVEYRPQHKVVAVEAATGTLKFEFQDDLRVDVANVLPPMRAADVAVGAGLATANGRWCEVDFLTFESVAARHVHVLGDALQTAPLMPKSGHMANAQAKACAAAIVAALEGWPVDPAPVLSNACYSWVDDARVVHVASVHAWDAAERTFKVVAGAGGLSPEPSATEARAALDWAAGIWSDMLGPD